MTLKEILNNAEEEMLSLNNLSQKIDNIKKTFDNSEIVSDVEKQKMDDLKKDIELKKKKQALKINQEKQLKAVENNNIQGTEKNVNTGETSTGIQTQV